MSENNHASQQPTDDMVFKLTAVKVVQAPDPSLASVISDAAATGATAGRGRKPGAAAINAGGNNALFTIQLFGMDTAGNQYKCSVRGFRPYLYVMVTPDWTKDMLQNFVCHLYKKLGLTMDHLEIYKYISSKYVYRRKFYGYDGKTKHKFIELTFRNQTIFNTVKNLWFTSSFGGHLRKDGYIFNGTSLKLYESHVTPLLRFYHDRDINPSGWVSVSAKHVVETTTCSCEYDFETEHVHVQSLPDKIDPVPYIIASFDIEADSSHGDFPLPVKTYKKLATNIVDYMRTRPEAATLPAQNITELFKQMILMAFGYSTATSAASTVTVDRIYPKEMPSRAELLVLFDRWIDTNILTTNVSELVASMADIENHFATIAADKHDSEDLEDICAAAAGDSDDDSLDSGDAPAQLERKRNVTPKSHVSAGAASAATGARLTVLDIWNSVFKDQDKIIYLNSTLSAIFPEVEGDKVTCIGTTFMKYGSTEPYLHHCITLHGCIMPEETNMKITQIESYKTEREVLLAWQRLIQRVNPTILIGYNTDKFDYDFMFLRAKELDCEKEFLQLSCNGDEICGKINKYGEVQIETKSIQIASGQHDLKYFDIPGRIHIDLYNFYRRTDTLDSYKLDFVAGTKIRDKISKWECVGGGAGVGNGAEETILYTGNLTGLYAGSYIHLEEISHSVNRCEEKYYVKEVNRAEKYIVIRGHIHPNPAAAAVMWCLAKDDITPKDIFRLSNGSDADRGIVAKYCIQDCNLVQYLFNKSDILTGFIEMSNICSVPLEYLAIRGQSIKLLSIIAKECRRMGILMPTLDNTEGNEGYEGACVFDPKCSIYTDNPIACLDYNSLYPSCMDSERLSQETKVYTKTYNLANELIAETGDKDAAGNYYTAVPRHEYVTREFDVYEWRRKTPKARATKVKVGRKECCFIQYPDGELPVITTILRRLIKARKDTRALQKTEKDPFKWAVLEQRQLGCKVTANSVYGGTGASTSQIRDLDIAACTTEMGRKSLLYGRRIIEECFKDRIMDTAKQGKVMTHAEHIYGDTDSVFFTFNLTEVDGVTPIRGKRALEITIELAQVAGKLASSFLKEPHNFEYEKTLMPFCLLSKKRYVGILYESNPEKYKCRKEMGIAIRRRDNSPIVKDTYGGVIDIVMKTLDIRAAIEFLRGKLAELIRGEVPLDKLTISKSLRGEYKKTLPAHRVLADRMGARDPGDKPSAGDRIPYVFIKVPGKKKDILQSHRVETPAYVREHGVELDYVYYITNQIMKPVLQFFALVLEQIWDMSGEGVRTVREPKLCAEMDKAFQKIREKYVDDPVVCAEKILKKREALRCKEIKYLLFDEFIAAGTPAAAAGDTADTTEPKKPRTIARRVKAKIVSSAADAADGVDSAATETKPKKPRAAAAKPREKKQTKLLLTGKSSAGASSPIVLVCSPKTKA